MNERDVIWGRLSKHLNPEQTSLDCGIDRIPSGAQLAAASQSLLLSSTLFLLHYLRFFKVMSRPSSSLSLFPPDQGIPFLPGNSFSDPNVITMSTSHLPNTIMILSAAYKLSQVTYLRLPQWDAHSTRCSYPRRWSPSVAVQTSGCQIAESCTLLCFLTSTSERGSITSFELSVDIS